MDKPKTTPKDFFMWTGAMVALYASVVAFIALIFDYINYVFPDTTLSYYIDPYQSGISYEMAALIVIAPVFLLLMRLIRRDIARDPSRNEIWVRRWALFLVLFVAGVTIVVDLIVLLNTFLGGEELTMRFLLKVAVVLLVSAAGFMHFISDLRGYWTTFPDRARYVNWAAAVLIVISVVAGFFIVGTPGQARLVRIDMQRVNDLQTIQREVVTYYQQKQKLPVALSDVSDPLSYTTIPLDPASKQPYEYRISGPLSFEVCATFDAVSSGASSLGLSAPRPVLDAGIQSSFQHGVGRTCFSYTIDPQRYPPLTAPTPKPF